MEATVEDHDSQIKRKVRMKDWREQEANGCHSEALIILLSFHLFMLPRLTRYARDYSNDYD